MNALAWIILAVITAFHLLDEVAAFLNLNALKKTAPGDFDGIYDAENYRKLVDYTAVNTRFGMAHSVFDLLALVVFWFAGGFGALDGATRALHWNPVPTGLVFIGALALGKMLLSLPFDCYHTFVIEHRFGFNTTTPRLFIADMLKGLALAALLGAPLLAIILALFQYGGPHAWLAGWAIVTAFMLLMAFVAPAVIMPLFNKFEPLENGALRDAIMQYGSANRFPIAGIFVMDGSKRSAKANAFFTGFGATKKIVLFDTLIRNHTVEELVAVLAHEVGHFKHKHVIRHMLFSILNIGVVLFLASIFIRQPALHAAFGVGTVSVYCGLTLFMVVYAPLSRIISVLAGFQSRAHEFDADRFAVETTHESGAMVNALKKLSKNNLSNPAPHPLAVVLYHSHPPVLKRIEAIRAVPV